MYMYRYVHFVCHYFFFTGVSIENLQFLSKPHPDLKYTHPLFVGTSWLFRQLILNWLFQEVYLQYFFFFFGLFMLYIMKKDKYLWWFLFVSFCFYAYFWLTPKEVTVLYFVKRWETQPYHTAVNKCVSMTTINLILQNNVLLK